MTKLILKFGLIAGIIISALMLITMPYMGDTIDYDTGQLLGYLSMIVALSAIFVGIKNYRDKEMNGTIGFAKAFQVGSLITFVASIIYVISWLSYMNISDSNFIDSYKEYMMEELQESGETQVIIDENLAEIENAAEMYRNPLVQIGITFLEIFPVGLLVSLIAAVLLTKKSAVSPG